MSWDSFSAILLSCSSSIAAALSRLLSISFLVAMGLLCEIAPPWFLIVDEFLVHFALFARISLLARRRKCIDLCKLLAIVRPS